MNNEIEKARRGDGVKRMHAKDTRPSVLCRKCGAVLMRAAVLPPGVHDLTCPVCGAGAHVEVSGGTLAKVAAAAGSVADEFRQEAERKRGELIAALRARKIGDPITGSLVASILVSSAISAGAALAAGLITNALTPRQQVTTGSLAGHGELDDPKTWGRDAEV